MRAVNLVPSEQRQGAGGAAGRSGGAAFVLLGFLAALVVLAGVYTLQNNTVEDKRAELARVEAQAGAAEARAATLAPFTQFAALRATRTNTIFALAAARFDWSHSLSELARVIPEDVSLTTLNASVAPGVGGTGGSASGLRATLPLPAVEMAGCTSSQNSVARMLKRMRLIDGVTRVALQSSVKPNVGGGAQGGTEGGAGCDAVGEQSPTFSLVVFFDPAVGAVPTGDLTADTTTGGAP